MAMQWRERYSCSHPEIDRQHRRLFEIGSMLSVMEPLYGMHDFREELETTVTELKAYTKYHFDFEEQLMLRVEYPVLQEHVQLHRAFIEQVEKVEQQIRDAATPPQIETIIDFIETWISTHIFLEDRKYIPFLKSDPAANPMPEISDTRA